MAAGRWAAAAVVMVVAALVAGGGCATSTTATEGTQEVDQGYVAGDGSLVQLAPADRGQPVELAGQLLTGQAVDVTDWRGEVVVLNTWFAACGPCRQEAPDLAAISAETAPEGVQFLGINTRDGTAQAIAFEEQYEVPYPSVMDRDGQAVLGLRGALPPTATPTTLVLDRQGRVSARFLGQIDPGLLREVIAQVLGEPV
ncbi:TlpA disulfide reductase family protein [uncultured Pseudokineococcus sp.]|uniref:TlpA family protein disulfide reductase n=1 Tax=uncultured Pseudokineococcus sp. TaxID=1642928 RepID=UPI002623EDEE|nr:TlpA disulfide reductase family protein [uncultured Pseudokineococcus sp.]